MSRILFSWELGAGLGHLNRMLPVARALRQRGHDVFLVVQDLSKVQRLLAPGDDFLWFQAPAWLPPLRDRPPAATWAEILFHTGFLDAPGLLGLARGWHALFAAIRPDVLVADHAPVSLLTARGVPVRRMTLGTGFFHPPALVPLPVFRHWDPPAPGRVTESEALALGSANAVLAAMGQPPLDALRELVDVDLALLTTWPELDHYDCRPAGAHRYIGPITTLDSGVEPSWPAGRGPRLFAYLKNNWTALPMLLERLQQGPARTLAYVSNATAGLAERYSSPWLEFSPEPVRLDQALAAADAVICHAGMGTVSAALQAGRPLLALPQHPEQRLVAERVAGIGCGLHLAEPEPLMLQAALAQLTSNAGLDEAAKAFASRHAERRISGAIERAAAAIDALAGSP